MTNANLLRRPGKVLNQDVQRERRADAARKHGATIYDFPSSVACSPVQLKAFDREIGNLHGAVAVANHDIYGDPLPAGVAVQRRGGDGEDSAQVHAAAERGVRGGGGRLPYAERIQAAFGAHDVSGIAAHVGGAATEACDDMGASAYATGASVAFRGAPDLHTAAHEAAHIVQQRAGVSLKGGVGAVGDRYEAHADRVADLVVRGQSAEHVLNEMVGGGRGGGVQKRGVQQKRDVQRASSKWLDAVPLRDRPEVASWVRAGMSREDALARYRERKAIEKANDSPIEAMRQVFGQIAQVIANKWNEAAAGAKASLAFKIPVPLSAGVTFEISVEATIQKLVKACKITGKAALKATAGIPFLKEKFGPSVSFKVDASITATGSGPRHAMQLIQLGVYNRLDPRVANWLLGADFGNSIPLGDRDSVETTVGAGLGIDAKGPGGTVSAEVAKTNSQVTDKAHRRPGSTTTNSITVTGTAGPYTGQGVVSSKNGEVSFEATGTLNLTFLRAIPKLEAKIGDATGKLRAGIQKFLSAAANKTSAVTALKPFAKMAANASKHLDALKLGGNLPNAKSVKVKITVRRDSKGVEYGSIEVELTFAGSGISVGAGDVSAKIELTQDQSLKPITWKANT